MSEIPQRIEQEMFEIRSRMAADVTDLRKHLEPQFIGKRVKSTIMERIKGALGRAASNLMAGSQNILTSAEPQLSVAREAGGEILTSARHQLSLAREAGETRNPAPLTDAVKSDPRPLVVLAILVALILMIDRKMSNSQE